MARVKFEPGQQRLWISQAIESSNFTLPKLATICGFNRRTLNGWQREETTIPEIAVNLISSKTRVPYPTNVKILKDFWNSPFSSKLGAKRRMELYGPPGTRASRIRGGHMSQIKRRLHPELYKNCNLPKQYALPAKTSSLSELMGIILGDGGITHDQLKITLDKNKEREYLLFVSNLLEKIFKEKPKVYEHKNPAVNVSNITITGVNLIKCLKHLGLKTGNKVKAQVKVPCWIRNNSIFSRRCLKGLIDTDGGVYFHHHASKYGKIQHP